MKTLPLVLLAVLCLGPVRAQTPMQTEFPPDAAPIGADALRERLGGKVFHARVADGNHQRLQFNANGYAFFNNDRGFADDGKWRTEDSRFCMELKKSGAGCAESRVKGEAIFFKRWTNGEVVEMKAQ